MRMDLDLAAEIIETDKKIDEMEHQVDSLAVNLIALRQPMATDLRVIVAALNVASNLERIGDYAKNISKRAVTLSRADQVTNISIHSQNGDHSAEHDHKRFRCIPRT